jgi:hypothetical protein
LARPEAWETGTPAREMFLRTLRPLRDLRRYMPAMIVPNTGTVNVGAQQINKG